MNLHTVLATQNPCYKAAVAFVPRGVMIHSTGANNPKLKRYVGPDDGLLGINQNKNYMNNPAAKTCVHAFIGKLADGSIASYQILPWDIRGWHCGKGEKGSANKTHIGIEICEDGLSDRDYFNAVYREAVELTAMLCKEYNFDPLAPGVVICHSEGWDMGIASNHGDVYHWFPKHGKRMDNFRADVALEMENDVTQEQFDKMMENWLSRQADKPASAWAKKLFDDAIDRGITDGQRPQALATRQEVALMIRAATL